MRLQRVKALAGKEVKKMFREPAVVFMIIMFPIVFVTAFGISFGGAGATQPPTSPTVLLDLLAVGASSVIILLAGILLHRRYYS
ncbi:MAG: hypothetical protein QXS42_02365 [Zestosphaera sp.]